MTPEEVAAIQVRIKLTSKGHVGFDNVLTGQRERWRDGVLVDTTSMENTEEWNEFPNPWANDADGHVKPY